MKRRLAPSVLGSLLLCCALLGAACVEDLPQVIAQPLDGVDEVAAGVFHTCALMQDTTVRCWGSNAGGQTGDPASAGSTGANPVPVAVPGLSDVTGIDAGSGHTCASRYDGTVACWGTNRAGETGDPATAGSSDPHAAPVTVAGVEGVTQIALGSSHSCALRDDGTVWCWGLNFLGQTGDPATAGSIDPNPVPVQVAGLAGPAVQISAGAENTCALLTDATVACWGDNQLGNSGHLFGLGLFSEIPSPVPSPVMDLEGVMSISAGGAHTCALLADRTVWCSGSNELGQLGPEPGLGTQDPNPYPVQVPGLSYVRSVRAGATHTCATLGDNTVTCWGANRWGQLGRADNAGTTNPNPSVGPVGGLGPVDSLSAGVHSCAVIAAKVSCWGWNRFGQLGSTTGNGTDDPNHVPTPVMGT